MFWYYCMISYNYKWEGCCKILRNNIWFYQENLPHPPFEINFVAKFPFFSSFVLFRGPLWVRVLECSMLSCVLSKLSASRASTNPHRGLSICFWLTEYWPKLMSLFSKRLCLKHAICYKKLLYRLMVQLSLSNNPTTVITIMIGK